MQRITYLTIVRDKSLSIGILQDVFIFAGSAKERGERDRWGMVRLGGRPEERPSEVMRCVIQAVRFTCGRKKNDDML